MGKYLVFLGIVAFLFLVAKFACQCGHHDHHSHGPSLTSPFGMGPALCYLPPPEFDPPVH